MEEKEMKKEKAKPLTVVNPVAQGVHFFKFKDT